MANRYWVGGSNVWNTTAGTKWATTSGGAGGAAVPLNTDNVFFNAASGNVSVESNGSMNCWVLDTRGFVGELKIRGNLRPHGNVILGSGMRGFDAGNSTTIGNLVLTSTTNFYPNGIPIGIAIRMTNASATYTFSSNMKFSSNSGSPSLRISAGTININAITLEFVNAGSLWLGDTLGGTKNINISGTSVLFSYTPDTSSTDGVLFYNGNGMTMNSSGLNVVVNNVVTGCALDPFDANITVANGGSLVINSANRGTFSNITVNPGGRIALWDAEVLTVNTLTLQGNANNFVFIESCPTPPSSNLVTGYVNAVSISGAEWLVSRSVVYSSLIDAPNSLEILSPVSGEFSNLNISPPSRVKLSPIKRN